MSADYPQHLDPWRAASDEWQLKGSIPISQLKRLHDKLEMDALASQHEVAFSADFSTDGDGRPVIHLCLDAQVPLCCQRTLAVYDQCLSSESQVVVVESDTEAELIAEEFEPVLLDEKLLAVRDLVEEELLLAIPLVPLDPDAPELSTAEEFDDRASDVETQLVAQESSESTENSGGDTRKAFADLAAMMAAQKRDQ